MSIIWRPPRLGVDRAELRDALFSNGLSFNTASCLSEAGNAELIRARIIPTMQQRLDQTIVAAETVPIGLRGVLDAGWLDAIPL